MDLEGSLWSNRVGERERERVKKEKKEIRKGERVRKHAED